MKRIAGLILLGVLISSWLSCKGTAESDWPGGTVQIYVPSRAGGFADAHARLVANYLQKKLGKPFVIVNQAAGSGTVAYANVMKARPDGYTLLMFHTSFPVACYTGVFRGDPDKDFTTIAAMQNGGYNVIVANAKAPWDSLEDLVADAKTRPGKIKWGALRGGTSAFFPELLSKDTGVKFKIVNSGSESVKAVNILGGHIDVTNLSINKGHKNAQAGKMKILGIVGEKRDTTYPQYPTGPEQGFPNLIWAGEFGLYGPAGMDPAVVEKINSSLKDFGKDEKVAETLDKLGSWYQYRNVNESQEWMSTKIHQRVKNLCIEFGWFK